MLEPPPPSKGMSNSRTILFMIVLSFICALLLSTVASALSERKEIAKNLDRNKQMLIAAKILDHKGYFLLKDSEGHYGPAKISDEGLLVPATEKESASTADLLTIYKQRLVARLVNDQGEIFTFEEAGIDLQDYLVTHRKTGYYKLPFKLIYLILPNKKQENLEPEGYVIPINGFGLWDAMYGYLAIKADGNTVIGISWYDQKETPGLGANIAEPFWQDQFAGKYIFQEIATGKTDRKTTPIGIVVVKGKVSEVLGDSPKAKSAVDGMAGATLTGNGVTDAYTAVLKQYRPFLMRKSN